MDAGTALLIILLCLVMTFIAAAVTLGLLAVRAGRSLVRRVAPGTERVRRGALAYRAQTGPQQRR